MIDYFHNYKWCTITHPLYLNCTKLQRAIDKVYTMHTPACDIIGAANTALVCNVQQNGLPIYRFVFVCISLIHHGVMTTCLTRRGQNDILPPRKYDIHILDIRILNIQYHGMP